MPLDEKCIDGLDVYQKELRNLSLASIEILQNMLTDVNAYPDRKLLKDFILKLSQTTSDTADLIGYCLEE